MMSLTREAFAIAAANDPSRAEQFRAFFDTHQRRVYTLALRFAGDEAAADDIAQAVFVKVYDKLGTFRGDADATTWLFRIVHNTCLDHHRRQGAIRSLKAKASALDDAAAASPEAELDRAQQRELVHRAISELDPKYRTPVLLKYLEGMSYKEIAEALGWSLGTVASRLNRAHDQLARKLAKVRR